MKKICLLLIFSVISFAFAFSFQDDRIVLVNVGTVDRSELAMALNRINQCSPFVIGVDLIFEGRTTHDSELVFALHDTDKLVLANSIFDYDGESESYKRFESGSLPEFTFTAKLGFINNLLDDPNTRTISTTSLYEIVGGQTELHFSTQIAMLVDSATTARFLQSSPRRMAVNFPRRLPFKCVGVSTILKGEFDAELFKNKVVLLGFLGPGNDDKFKAPYGMENKKGKLNMYGLEFLALIVSQILSFKE